MSTLVTTHDGLERVVRGGQAFADLINGRREAGVRDAAAILRGRLGTLIARTIERARQRREDRAFEQLMHDDPRVCAEVRAAAARAEVR
ncbi:MAG: hypothetical protein KJ011_11830 [Burkholderiaceae bacterium]|nr:hypothetical protein [Burkholderiaceae bacterium]